jgi:hypothetical protein
MTSLLLIKWVVKYEQQREVEHCEDGSELEFREFQKSIERL